MIHRALTHWLLKTLGGLLVLSLFMLLSSRVWSAEPPLVVIKLDDMRNDQEDRWQRVIDFLAARKIKAGIGIISQSLEGDQPAYFERLKNIAKTGYVEFWNHGYDHCTWKKDGVAISEFEGTSLAHQREHLEKSQQLALEKIGVEFTAFGAPFNATDESTARVLAENPRIKVWLFGDASDPAGKFIGKRTPGVNIEKPVHRPNFEAFKKGYAANPLAEYFVIQGHPPSWKEEDFTEFARIIEFLLEKKTAFVTPSELPAAVKASLPAPSSTMTLISDVPYLTPDRGEKLDVYLPPSSFARPLPAVLLIHGGGWHMGDKAGDRERNIGTTLANNGYVVFSINYLLNLRAVGPDNLPRISRLAWPQNLYDCKTALRYIRTEATRYNVDPGLIAVMGSSAGAHLAMLVGATGKNPEFNTHGLNTDQSNNVSCILSFYGDYDIRGRSVSAFAGATPVETLANEKAASPITYLDANAPPMFITHGTSDTTVPVERSRLLAQHLHELGVEYRYIEIPNAPHSYHLEPKQLDLRPAVLEFLKTHLHTPPVEQKEIRESPPLGHPLLR